MSTLLITSAIQPPNGISNLKIINPAVRLISTKAAIYFWICSGIKKITIIDSTDNFVLNDSDLKLAKSLNVSIEQLKFSLNSDILINKGKSMGEALIIKYAIENSQHIKSSKFIYKCTGKLFVNNFSQIDHMITSNNISNIFWRWGDGTFNLFKDFIDTRFFYTDSIFLKNELLPAMLESDESIEENLEFKTFQVCSKNFQFGSSIRPIIIGYGGGHGSLYELQNLGFLENNFPCMFSIVSN